MLSWCSLIKVERKFYCKASLKKIVTCNFAENSLKKFFIYFYKTVLIAWLQYCKYRLMLSWCSLIKVEHKFYCKASLKKIVTFNFAENWFKKFYIYFYKTVLVAWLQYCKYRLMLSWCSLIKVEHKFYCKASLKKNSHFQFRGKFT